MKKIHDPQFFCADQIDVITNSAVITNVIIKSVHCNCQIKVLHSTDEVKLTRKHDSLPIHLTYTKAIL